MNANVGPTAGSGSIVECMLLRKIDPLALRYLGILPAVVATVLAVQLVGQSLGRGRISGNVRSDGGYVLPGARVSVMKPDLTRSVVTNAEGGFDLSDLPEGAYTVTAELAGFQTTSQQNAIVRPDRTSIISLVLSIRCLFEVLYVDQGMLAAIQQTDAIVHLRISESGSVKRWDGGGVPCLDGPEYTAIPLRVAKSPPGQELTVSTIRFLQAGPVRYSPGDEYVALLRWNAGFARFLPVAGSLFMLPVRAGRVVWTRTDVPTLTDGMPVEGFLAALRALLPNSRP